MKNKRRVSRALCLLGARNLSSQNILFARSAVLTSLMLATSTILGLATSVILARALGAEGLGIYSAALAMATVLTVVLSCGLPGAIIVLVARYRAEGRSAAANAAIRWCYAHVVAASFILFCGGTAILYFTGWIPNDLRKLCLITILVISLWSALAMQSGILQGFNSIVYARFLDLVVLPSALLIAISFSVFVGGSKLAPDGAMASYGAAFAASILVGGIFVASTARAGPAGGATEKEPHTWYRLSLPMMASEVTRRSWLKPRLSSFRS